MAKNLYKVTYEERTATEGEEDASWVLAAPVTVVADDDARSAVAKVERKVVPSEFKWEDDEGKKRITKTIGFRLLSVEHISGIDYP